MKRGCWAGPASLVWVSDDCLLSSPPGRHRVSAAGNLFLTFRALAAAPGRVSRPDPHDWPAGPHRRPEFTQEAAITCRLPPQSARLWPYCREIQLVELLLVGFKQYERRAEKAPNCSTLGSREAKLNWWSARCLRRLASPRRGVQKRGVRNCDLLAPTIKRAQSCARIIRRLL